MRETHQESNPLQLVRRLGVAQQRRLLQFLATAVPLLLGMHWLAIHFPISEYEMSQSVQWEDEHTLVVSHDYSQGNYRWPSHVTRRYRLDINTGSLEFVSRSFSHGGLTSEQHDFLVPVSGCNSHYARLPHTDIDLLIEQLDIDEQASLAAGEDLVVLFSQHNQELARWALTEGRKIRTSKGYIVNRTKDGQSLEVRDALTGNLTTSISTASPRARTKVDWELYESFIRLYDQQQPLGTFELSTGRRLSIAGAWNGVVVDMLGANT